MPILIRSDEKFGTEVGQRYRADIDGLRAIAVLAVVFYHANLSGFSGGYVGVDIFFVISGYLITGIVFRDASRGRFSLKEFYIRRIKRIFPPLFFVIFASTLVSYLILTPSELDQYGRSLIATTLFFANFKFNKDINYYDTPAIEKPLLHTWSLSVEEQFYIVWPLALIVLMRLAPPRKLLPIIVVLATVSLILAEARMPYYQKDAFFLPWCRAWELLVGAAIAIASPLLRPGLAANVLSAGGLLSMAAAIVFYDPSTPFPGITAALPCFGAAAVIWAGTQQTPVTRLLSLGPVRFVGLISYSLYLIHWPLFSFAQMFFGKGLSLEVRLAIIIASFALAVLSWKYVETPFRNIKPARSYIFLSAAFAIGFCCVVGLDLSLNHGFPSRVSEEVLSAQAVRYQGYKGCIRPAVDVKDVGNLCQLGLNKGANYDFILWGDSHSEHFAPAIDLVAKSSGLAGLLLSKSGCPPFLDDSHKAASCIRFNQEVASWLSNKGLKFAILAGRWLNYSKTIVRDLDRKNQAATPVALSSTVAVLKGQNLDIVILDQVPDYPDNVSLCIARAIMHGRSRENCAEQPKSRFIARHKLLDDYFAFLNTRNTVSIASVAAAFCDKSTCNATHGKDILMADDNHMSIEGALFVAPFISLPISHTAFSDKRPEISDLAHATDSQPQSIGGSP